MRHGALAWFVVYTMLILLLMGVTYGCTMYVTPVTMQPIICMEGTVLDKDTGQEIQGFRCVPEDYNK